MKKNLISLTVPVIAALLLSGCGESADSGSIPLITEADGAEATAVYKTEPPETTLLTTHTTLKPFSQITSVTKFSLTPKITLRSHITKFSRSKRHSEETTISYEE